MDDSFIPPPSSGTGNIRTTGRQVRVNPYKLFQIDPDSEFTRADIRQKMRQLVLSTHPDRPGGSDTKFRVVMGCYKHILQVISERERIKLPVTDETIRTHTEARGDQSKSFEIPNTNLKRFQGSKKFDSKAFNEFFEENRLDDTLRKGHGDWLKDGGDEYEATHHEKMGKGQFQEAFEEERKRLLKKKQIVKHTGIVPMSIGKSRLATADVDDIGMMSTGNAGTVRCSNGVMGVDLREALEVGVLGVTSDDSRIHGDRRISMEEAQRQRDTARMTFTDEEKREYSEYQAQQERKERERKKRIMKRDEQIRDHFQRINRMITN
jgi:hypothetical protein